MFDICQIEVGVVIALMLASWGLSIVNCAILKRARVFDQPNQRSSHKDVVVRGGGLVPLVLTVGYCSFVGRFPLGCAGLLGIGVVALISFIDDVRSLSARVRIVLHLAGALCLAGALHANAGESGLVPMVWFVVTVPWIIYFLNIYNFMDGINGLATMQTIVSSVAGVLVLVVSGSREELAMESILLQVCLAATCLGFLPYNFPKARLFLGDVGSTFFGMVSGLMVLIAWQLGGWVYGVVMIGVHLNFILDTGITIIRRLIWGHAIHEAHREHFYQRAVRAGMSHLKVTSLEASMQLVASGLLIATAVKFGEGVLFAFFGVAVLWIGVFLCFDKAFQNESKKEI